MSREKPESVDPRAWWSASDNEWVFGDKDADGQLHGRVTYWRPDGTLVNHCDHAHGTPHGAYARYHESGEVSRQGTIVHGKIQGTDVFLRTDSATTERFPAGLGEAVWRAEMDMVAGRVVGGRLFDRDGRQVAEDGTPCPPRPDGVPEAALYSSTSGRWVLGETDDAYLRTGPWRFYTQEGWVQQETEYVAGEVVADTVHPTRHHAEAASALRDADPARCIEAVEAGLAAHPDEVEQHSVWSGQPTTVTEPPWAPSSR